MVTLVQFMLRAAEYSREAVQADAAEFADVDATERLIVEETVHVDR